MTDPTDEERAAATSELAEMYRNGLHDLMPYWSPDCDCHINPLDDPEVQATVRSYISRRISALQAVRGAS